MENNIPTTVASNISNGPTRNVSNININAPVLINIGGKIIFFAFIGLFAAFILIKITINPIKMAIIDEATYIDITIILIHNYSSIINDCFTKGKESVAVADNYHILYYFRCKKTNKRHIYTISPTFYLILLNFKNHPALDPDGSPS